MADSATKTASVGSYSQMSPGSSDLRACPGIMPLPRLGKTAPVFVSLTLF